MGNSLGGGGSAGPWRGMGVARPIRPHATFVELTNALHMAPVTKSETVHPALLAHAHRAGVV